MSVLTTSTPTLVPSIISAVAALISTIFLAWVALRAQRAEEQLERIEKIVNDAGDRIVERFKEALRDVIGTSPHKRRWYE